MNKEQQIQKLVQTSDASSIDIGDIGGNAATKTLAEYWASQDVSGSDMATDLKGAAVHLLALSLIADGRHTDFDEAESAVKHLLSELVN